MKKRFISASLLGLLLASSSWAAVISVPSLPGVVDNLDGTYEITQDLTLYSGNEYILEGFTFVNAGKVLSIEEGVIVRGQPAGSTETERPGSLIISRGAQICANGTEEDPIIFTTAANAANRGRWTSGAFYDANPKDSPLEPITDTGTDSWDNAELWGAVTILGYAPLNTNKSVTGVAGEDVIEGFGGITDERVRYGGRDPHDSSGTLKYVSIRHSGATSDPNQEQQGLTLGGVGNGTTIRNIDIYCSADDGIEIFGGTVNISNFVISYAADDGLDIDQGYVGCIQFGLIIGSSIVPPTYGTATGLQGDYLAEWDGDDDISADGFNVSATGAPFASPTIQNLTFVGPRGIPGATLRGGAIHARQGFGGDIRNSIFVNLPEDKCAFRITNTGTDNTNNLPNEWGYPSVKSGDRVVAGTHNYSGNLWYNVADNTAANIACTSYAEDVLNNVPVKCFINQVGVNPGMDDLDQTWGGESFNPVPNPANTTGSAVYIDSCSTPCCILPVDYIGAFDPTAGTGNLWTTGWTALNKGIVLVD